VVEPSPVDAAVSSQGTFDRRLAIAAVVVVAAAIAWFGLMRLTRSAAPDAPAPAAAVAPAPPPAAVDTPSNAAAPAPSPAASQPAAATTPPAATATTGETFHITVAAFRTEQRASEVAATLKARGLPMSTRFDSASEWHLVIAGPFKSSADAAAAQRTLTSEGFTDTRVVSDNQ
jgi:cell division protein FtsN